MDNGDTSWQQRFSNFVKALGQLERFVQKGLDLNELEAIGMIKAFEYTYELAWNTIKDFYEDQGETGLQGSRDAIQLAFKRGLIADGDTWMQMLTDRIRTVDAYNEEVANEIAGNILIYYYRAFTELRQQLESKAIAN